MLTEPLVSRIEQLENQITQIQAESQFKHDNLQKTILAQEETVEFILNSV